MTDLYDTLTVEEAAALLKVNPVTVQRELRAGRLPGNTVGRAWRIHRADLREYLRGRRRDPRQAIERAHVYLYDEADLDKALVTLVGALGYEDMPLELRFALTRRVAVLMDARDAPDVDSAQELVEKTRWDPQGDDAFAITYFPTVSGVSPPWSVSVPRVWNQMLNEFAFALRTRHRLASAVGASRRQLILRWQDNSCNEVPAPRDAAECEQVIEAVVPAGTLVVMVKYRGWTVVKAEAQRVHVGPGPYDLGYDDFKEVVVEALEEARRPREDYPELRKSGGQPPNEK